MASKSLGYSVTAVDQASRTFVAMAAQVERLAKRLDALDGKTARVTVDADTSRAHQKIETLDKSFGAATIRVAALGRAMGTLALPGAIVAATPAIASLGQSAVTASGALWLLPAAATAGGVAMAALKVGMAGFGEAMKNLGDPEKFAEAIAKLSPAARDAAVAVRALVPAWKEMQQSVQDRLFAGMATQIAELGKIYLPILGEQFGRIADAANGAALSISLMLRTSTRIADMKAIGSGAASVFENLARAVGPIAAAFIDIAAVGMPVLVGLTDGARGAAISFQQFIAQARATGQLEGWIRGGLEQLRLLGQLTVNVGSILGSVFGAAAASGESFLLMLVRVTGQMAAALKTPEGAAGLTEFFVTVRTLVGLLWDRLVQLWPAISAAGQAFAALMIEAGPLSAVLFDLVVSALVPMLDTIRFLAPVLGPLIPIFFAVAGAAKLWTLATAGVTAAMTAYRVAVGIATAVSVAWQLAMGTNLVLTEAQVAAQTKHTVATYAGTAAARVATAAQWVWTAALNGTLFSLIAQRVAMVGTTVATYAQAVAARAVAVASTAWAATQWVLTAALNGSLFVMIAQRVAMLGAAAAMVVVRGAVLAWTAVQWLLNAALLANPIGLVVLAIAGLVTALVLAWQNSETFRAVVIAAWTAIQVAAVTVFGFVRDFIVSTWAIIQGAFTVAIGFLAPYWNAFWSGMQAVVSLSWGFVQAVVQAGWAVLQGIFGVAVAGLTAAWNVFWAGLQLVAQVAFAAVQAIVRIGWAVLSAAFQVGVAAVSAIWNILWAGLRLVAEVAFAAVRAAVQVGWAVLQGVFSVGIAFVSGVWNVFWAGLRLVATVVFEAILTVIGVVWAAIRGIFQTFSALLRGDWQAAWDAIRNTAVTIWGLIASFLGNAFNAFSAFFRTVWTAVSTFFGAIWDAIRNIAVTVWTAISAFFTAAFAAFQAFFATVWNAVSAFFLATWNAIRTTATTIWTAIAGFFAAAFAAWQAFFASVWNAVVAFFVATWNAVRSTAVDAWNAIAAFFTGAFAAFTRFFTDTWNNIVGTFDRIWSSITGIAERVWGAVRGAFVGGVNAIIDIINSFAGAINRVAGLLGFNINLGIPRLAGGGEIAAVRRALGGPITADVIPRAAGGGVDATGGGRLPATGTLRDTLPALAGRQPYLLQGREWIVRSGASRALGADKMAMINQADRRPVDVVPRAQLRKRVALYRDGGPLAPIPMASAGEIAAAATALVPGSRMSSGFRPGDPGMHGRNQAADMVGNLPAINRAWAGRYGASTDQLIYTPGINLFRGRPHTYNAATRADHYDHVHIGYAGALGEGGGGVLDAIGGFFRALLRPVVEGLLSPLRNMLVPIRDDAANGLGKRMVAGTGLKLIDWLIQKATEQDEAAAATGVVDVSGISGPVVDQVRQVAARYGWDQGPEWNALYELVRRESSWNPNAANPTSSARGLFQKMTSLHGPVEPTAAGQAAWGLNYIQGRYGSPSRALAFHDRNNHYDRGGLAFGRGIMWKDTIRPERMLDPDTTVTFERLTDWLDSPAAQRMLTARPGQFPALNPALAAAGQLRRGRGGGVTVNLDNAQLVAAVNRLDTRMQELQRVVREARPVNVYGTEPVETGQAVALRMRM